MNRRIGIWIIIVALVAGDPAAAWLIGLNVEHQWEQREQQILAKYPYVAVVKRDYHRGVYSATEEVTYGLRDPLLKSLRAIPGSAAWSGDLQLTLRHTIHHGPLPQLRAFAPATVDTEWELPPKLSQQLAAAFGSNTHLNVHTRMKWLGGSTTVLQSSAFEQQLSDGTTLAWRGFDGRIDLGRDIGAASVRLTFPGVDLKSPKGSLGLQDLKLSTDLQPTFDELTVGSTNMTVARVDIDQTVKGFKASAQNLSLDSKSSVNGEYMDMDVRFGVDALQAGQFSATRLVYETRFDHIHGPSLASFTKGMQAAQTATSTTPSPDKIQAVFKTDGVEILLRDPVLEIPRIGFTMPEGELLISLKATMPGITRAQLDGPSNAIIPALVKHLQASADMRIDKALLDKLLNSSGKSDTLTGQLQALQGQGYIKLDGQVLTTHLRYQDGKLKVNDLPFPPHPAQQ